ncbi:MAG TPA: YebC/PmpR family DNA-binding transcriptional regulator [Prolixibacteraceae bacterium]|nr:YebC/PmpR family DNA-binding transcriptional regulator [Prolixibacteraceae bacterium]
MSGHSKWSKIKRKKGALDAKRSNIFSRLSKEITVAVKEGGISDPSMNAQLRIAVLNAKGQNMPKDNIDRAISKGEKDGNDLAEIFLEAYGAGRVAVFVECLSDNNNRTVADIRHIITKRGGSLATNGSLSFIFDRKGVFTIPVQEGTDMEELELEFIEAGAEDVEVDEDVIIITTALEDFGNFNKKLEELKIEAQKVELQRIPKVDKRLAVEDAKVVMRMIEELEDNEDVQNVYHNLEMTEELERALEEE